MNVLEKLLGNGETLSRAQLASALNMPDRRVRLLIREARREGIPIMALQGGGYKLAKTREEKQKLLHMYKGRAMDELVTYGALRRTIQADGQIKMEDIEQ